MRTTCDTRHGHDDGSCCFCYRGDTHSSLRPELRLIPTVCLYLQVLQRVSGCCIQTSMLATISCRRRGDKTDEMWQFVCFSRRNNNSVQIVVTHRPRGRRVFGHVSPRPLKLQMYTAYCIYMPPSFAELNDSVTHVYSLCITLYMCVCVVCIQ